MRRGTAEERLRTALSEKEGAAHCLLVSNGRAALTLILRTLRILDRGRRDEVIIPSFTCYSVAASVVRAGLKPRLADITAATLDYDQERLPAADTRRVLAMIATNLYGLPNDLPALQRFAQERGLYLVDDAAQALGASVAGRASGTWGDAGLYSFDKGKSVSAIEGGAVITTSHDLAGALAETTGALRVGSLRRTLVRPFKVVGYSALLRPSLYWIPNSVPQLGLGTTVFSTEFPVERMAPSQAALALTMLRRLPAFREVRRRRAEHLAHAIAGMPGLAPISVVPGARPAYIRFPILAQTPRLRTSLLKALAAAGCGASASYPTSIGEIPQLRSALVGGAAEWKVGADVARRILTLPTHPYVTDGDVTQMAAVLANALERTATADQTGPWAEG